MAEKYATEGKIEAEAEVIIYVMILEMLEKHEKVLEVLSGPLAGKFKVLTMISLCAYIPFITFRPLHWRCRFC